MKRHTKKSKSKTVRAQQETKPSTAPSVSPTLSVKNDLIRTIVFVSIILVLEFLVFFANVNTKIVQMFQH
jgi:hypothetical protein